MVTNGDIHYPELEAAMLTKLGLATDELGDADAAERLLGTAVRQAAAVGSGDALLEAHLCAGSTARRRGNVGMARAHLHEALALSEGHAVLKGARVHVELAHAAANAAEPDVAVAHVGDGLRTGSTGRRSAHTGPVGRGAGRRHGQR
jgi:hypothetical protein